jgi:hypothetical protein
MSILIDDFMRDNKIVSRNERKQIGEKWYYAKPEAMWRWTNVIDSLKVLRGKSFAVHYKEDES